MAQSHHPVTRSLTRQHVPAGAPLDHLRQRLHTQHVAGARLEQPADVVRWLGAVQSQDYAGAKWSVGQRLRCGTDPDVERAFASGQILRTHVLRPTWHFVAPEDIRWMLQLTAPHVHALNAYYYRKLELHRAVCTRSRTLLTRGLQDGRHRTRSELAVILRKAGIVADGLRLAYVMMQAELDGLICSGAPRGKQHTYALLEERVPPARTLTRDEALAELAKRFFASHRPATLQHYVWWSGLSVRDAKAGLAMIPQHLSGTVLDGRTQWFGVARRVAKRWPTAAYLLPEYDESLVGYKDLAVPDLPRARRKGSWKDTFYRPIIIDGKRAGTWRRTIAAGAVVLETNLFAALNRAQARALRAAAERYGRFLNLSVTLRPAL